MVKRKGIIRRFIDRIFGTPPPPSVPPPRPPDDEPIPPVNLGTLRRQAARRIIETMPYAKADRVRFNVRSMDRDEALWTINATPADIQAAAARDADRIMRLPGGNMVPKNPWWYH